MSYIQMTDYTNTTFVAPSEDALLYKHILNRKKFFIDTIDQFDYDTMNGHIVIVRDFKDIAFENVRTYEFDYAKGYKFRFNFVNGKVKILFNFDLPEKTNLLQYPDELVEEFNSLGYNNSLYYYDDEKNVIFLRKQEGVEIVDFVNKNKLDLFKKFGTSFTIAKNPSQWLRNTLTAGHKILTPGAPDNVLTDYGGYTFMPIHDRATNCVVEELFVNDMVNVGFVWKVDLTVPDFITFKDYRSIPMMTDTDVLYRLNYGLPLLVE